MFYVLIKSPLKGKFQIKRKNNMSKSGRLNSLQVESLQVESLQVESLQV